MTTEKSHTVRTSFSELARSLQEEGSASTVVLLYQRNGVDILPLSAGKPFVIGREPPADIAIADRFLSREHARFELVANDVWVTDLNSTNGTRVNGQKIDRRVVRPGDEVSLGSITIVVQRRKLGEVFDEGPESHDHFIVELEKELVRAKTFSRKVAVIMLQQIDRDAGVGIIKWCSRARSVLRPVDTIALFGPDTVEILLPEAGYDETLRIAQTLIGLQGAGDIALHAGFAVFPDTAISGEALIETARHAMQTASSVEPIRAASVSRAMSSDPTITQRNAISHSLGAMMREIYHTVDKLAHTRVPVLLCGETGVGKEVIARTIHERGSRRSAPLLCINCGAIPSQLVESVLFGHERGAFTGADRQNKGLFEQAHSGTVLLDEVGELPLAAQAALLRVLETRRLTRVGSHKEIDIDVRVLSATHRNLDEMSDAGTFRRDLLYRLNAVTLLIPPLRDRREEIPSLIERFIKEANVANGCQIKGIDPSALTLLERYHWPGNIRELRNVVERAVIIAQEDQLKPHHFPQRIVAHTTTSRSVYAVPQSLISPAEREFSTAEHRTLVESVDPDSAQRADATSAKQPHTLQNESISFNDAVADYEQALILEALEEAERNQRQAALNLNMPLSTLTLKLRDYRLRHDGEWCADFAYRRTKLAAILREVPPNKERSFRENVEQYEAIVLARVLRLAGWNKSKAARRLGIPRRTLINKIEAYALKEESPS